MIETERVHDNNDRAAVGRAQRQYMIETERVHDNNDRAAVGRAEPAYITCILICGWREAQLDGLPLQLPVVHQHQGLGSLLHTVEVCQPHPTPVILPTSPTTAPIPSLTLHPLNLIRLWSH